MKKLPVCVCEGCEGVAAGVVAVDIYPYQALMAYYKSEEPLSRLMTTLTVCVEHVPESLVGVFPPEELKRFVATVEASSGISVDPEGSKVVLVPFTDPDCQRLLNNKERRHGATA